jgi:hypothetical protein
MMFGACGRWRPRLPAAAGVGLVAFALVGCGTRAGTLGTVVSAAALTLSRTAETSSTIGGAPSLGVGRTPVLARGAFVFPTGLGYEAVALPKSASRAARTVYLVFLRKTVYLQSLPGVTLPAGKRWVSASLVTSEPGRFTRFALQVESLNAELLLDEISWGATAATSLGHRVTNHIPYSEYRVSISLSRALAGAEHRRDGAISLAIKDEMGALASGGATRRHASVLVNAWVDGPGRIAQLGAAIPGSGLGTVSIVLSSFGTAIATSLPPGSQTVAIGSIPSPSHSRWLFGGGT